MQSLMAEFGMPAIPPDVLGRIAVQTSLIWGSDDGIVPVSVGQAASRAIRLAADRDPRRRERAGDRATGGLCEGGGVSEGAGDMRYLTPDDPAYPEATALWNGMVDRKPALRGPPDHDRRGGRGRRLRAETAAWRCRCAAAGTTSPARRWSTAG